MKTINEIIGIFEKKLIESIKFKEEDNWSETTAGFTKEQIECVDLYGDSRIILHIKGSTNIISVDMNYINHRQFGYRLRETRIMLACIKDQLIPTYPRCLI